jgi:hypothetical protein
MARQRLKEEKPMRFLTLHEIHVVARVFVPKQSSHLDELFQASGDCFVGKYALLATT